MTYVSIGHGRTGWNLINMPYICWLLAGYGVLTAFHAKIGKALAALLVSDTKELYCAIARSSKHTH